MTLTSVTDEELRVQQFIRQMQIIIVVSIVSAAIELGLDLLGLGSHLLRFVAAPVAMLAVVAYGGAWLAKSGRLSAGIFIWITGSSFIVALLPIVALGILPLLLLSAVMNILVAGLFISPRETRRVWPITGAASFVAIYLEYWWKGPRVNFTADLPWLALILNLTGIALVFYLVALQGITLARVIESLQKDTQELQRNRAALVEQTAALKATTGELVTRTGELEKANLHLQTLSQHAQRRAELLQTSSLVTHAVSQMRNLDELLPRITLLIARAFGYYHVGIFILDELSRFAVLRAANSESGQRMLARGYKVALASDESSRMGDNLIASVIKTRQPRTVRYTLDGADAARPGHPDLSETRAEIILPLSAGKRTIGALDAHSTLEAGFSQEALSILSSLADQIAIAIENAQLFARAHATLQEAQEAQARYVRQEWERLLPALSDISHEYRISGVPSVSHLPLPEMTQAIKAGNPVTIDAALCSTLVQATDQTPAYRSALAVPIKLRNRVIGAIDLHETDATRQWTEDDIALVSEVADQAAQALENVRLFEQTQRQAQREQLVTSIASRLRAASDVESVLRATVHEIRRALGASHGVVRLKIVNGQSTPEKG